ncbi:hypothetical protein [Streptomyces sp. BBFR102]|uniref:hypothetical protein n=1 Tax=Streptomyces sp. BBFR102 TaxID=3448171 RepID=UPI003F53AEDE
MGAHTREFRRRWHERYSGIALHLVPHNSPTGGSAEGLCDPAVVRTASDEPLRAHPRRLRTPPRGHGFRCLGQRPLGPPGREPCRRTLVVDRRTGTVTAHLWPNAERPNLEATHGIDDCLAAATATAATGRCVGVTPHVSATQYRRVYRRDGSIYRTFREAARPLFT